MSKKILWVSRHEMTQDQLAGLGSDVEITQYSENLSSPAELGELDGYAAVAAVYPLEKLQSLIDYCSPLPVLRAKTRRVFNEDGSKKEFVFDGWEVVDAVDVRTHPYVED